MKSTYTLDRVFDPISRCLTPAVARRIVNLQADQELNARIHELAEKANEGSLTRAERAEYETNVRAIHFFTVLPSKARRILKDSKI